MIGNDDNQEEVSFKVADKRKFNADGSVRDGVTLDAAKAAEPPAAKPGTEPATAPAPPQAEKSGDDPAALDQDQADESGEIPGAEDPASFVNFLSMLATNAASALGAVPNPATGQRSLDLETAKYWLDVLGMIRDKTKGNLHPKEDRLLEGLLADLRLQYVQLVKATEEKLRSQAAQKLSGADILGKK
ncbi:MAG: DUF1844 domain-containing protein [Pyrinomonadaceae bacterium]